MAGPIGKHIRAGVAQATWQSHKQGYTHPEESGQQKDLPRTYKALKGSRPCFVKVAACQHGVMSGSERRKCNHVFPYSSNADEKRQTSSELYMAQHREASCEGLAADW